MEVYINALNLHKISGFLENLFMSIKWTTKSPVTQQGQLFGRFNWLSTVCGLKKETRKGICLATMTIIILGEMISSFYYYFITGQTALSYNDIEINVQYVTFNSPPSDGISLNLSWKNSSLRFWLILWSSSGRRPRISIFILYDMGQKNSEATGWSQLEIFERTPESRLYFCYW